MSVRISPSILAADFARLAEAVERVEAGGADLIHVDVMDGHFVPNITMGAPVVAALKRVTKVPLDVHLMIDQPDRYLESFVKAGASMVTVHAEATPDLSRTLGAIRQLGAQAGVAISPATPVTTIQHLTKDLDYLLVMSVNPGFSGQAFMPHSIQKIAQAKALFLSTGSPAAIEVDGGVDTSNAAILVQAGASILVVGAAIFGTADPVAATKAIRRAAGGNA